MFRHDDPALGIDVDPVAAAVLARRDVIVLALLLRAHHLPAGQALQRDHRRQVRGDGNVGSRLIGSQRRPAAQHVGDNYERQAPDRVCSRRFSCHQLRFVEFLGIREDAPDRFPRRDDVVRERRVAVLEQGKHLDEQHVVGPAQFREGRLSLPLVVRAELVQEVVHLVLQRDLGEYADGLGLAESRLERLEIQWWWRRLGRRG